MKFCVNCGTQLADSVKFCSSCGAAQPPVQAQPSVQAQPPYNSQIYGSAPSEKPAKQRIVPIWAKVLIAVAGVAVAAVLILVLVVLPGVLNSAAKLDYYEIADDKVPSIKLALDEERKVIGTNSAVRTGDLRTKSYTYSVDANQGAELLTYSQYLRENDGFEFITDGNFNAKTGKVVQLARNSVKEGYMVVVQLDWDRSGYSVALMVGKGEVDPVKTDTVSTSTPAPTPTAEQTDSISLPNKMAYSVQGESIPSFLAVTGITREIVNLVTGEDSISVKYSVPGTEQGLELFEYTTYLQKYEDFIYLTDVNFNTPSGSGVQMGKNSERAGYALVVEFAWDTEGYTITLTQMFGSITLNEDPTPTTVPTTAPASGDLPPMLRTLSTATFTYTYTTNVSGLEMEGAISQQIDKYLALYKFDYDGESHYIAMIIRDGYTYSIDGDSETMTKTKSTPNDLVNLNCDFTSCEVMSRGDGVVDGETLPYVEYGLDGSSFGKYYLKNGDVYAIEVETMGDSVVMIITSYSGEVTQELFDPPEDFTVTEY